MKLSRGSISSAFGVELISGGGLWLPRILLQNYAKLGISNQEMMLLIHLLSLSQSENSSVPIREIAGYMDLSFEELTGLLETLSAKGFICGDLAEICIDENIFLRQSLFSELFEQTLELWGCEQARQFEQEKSISSRQEAEAPGLSKAVSGLYRCFEKEFGRPLSPMESTQIMEWYFGDQYTFELILEALKRAVLRGVVNFKYIDSILRGWSRNNIKTVKAVIAHEEAFSEQKKGKKKNYSERAAELDKKYKDIYLS